MRLYSGRSEREEEEEEEERETETKTKSLRSRINFNWITVNIVSAYVEASHSSSLGGALRVATCKVTTLSSYNELTANEQLSLNAK